LGVRLVGVATPSISIVLGLGQQLGRTQGLYPTFPEAEREETLVGQTVYSRCLLGFTGRLVSLGFGLVPFWRRRI